MKKLLSIFCCALCIHNFSQTPTEIGNLGRKGADEKTLIKALAVIIDPQRKSLAPKTIPHSVFNGTVR